MFSKWSTGQKFQLPNPENYAKGKRTFQAKTSSSAGKMRKRLACLTLATLEHPRSSDFVDCQPEVAAAEVKKADTVKPESCVENDELQKLEWLQQAKERLREKYGRAKPVPVEPQPVLKLDNCSRFKPSCESSSSGVPLELTMVFQFPSQQTFTKPVFQLAHLSKDYDKMEREMAAYYRDRLSTSKMTPADAVKGNYAVLRMSTDHKNTFCYKRIKFIARPSINRDTHYDVEFIDYFTRKWIQWSDNILQLDKRFAKLPPRACDIKMEGLHHYEGSIGRFVRYNSKDYAFEGTLMTEVQPNGQVIIWSDQCPKDKFPYGINEMIMTTLWKQVYPIKLPPVGFHKADGFVVDADKDGYICMQFTSQAYDHYMDVIGRIPNEDVANLQGNVRNPKMGEVYIVQYSGDEQFYRATIQHSDETTLTGLGMEDKVTVRFIDYGNSCEVKLKELVKTKDVHYLLGMFPEFCVKLHMANVKNLDSDAYINQYHSTEKLYIIQVVKENTLAEDGIPEVILKVQLRDANDDKRCINQQVTDGQSDLGQAIDPDFDYDSVPDRGPMLTEVKSRLGKIGMKNHK